MFQKSTLLGVILVLDDHTTTIGSQAASCNASDMSLARKSSLISLIYASVGPSLKMLMYYSKSTASRCGSKEMPNFFMSTFCAAAGVRLLTFFASHALRRGVMVSTLSLERR
jgi:hypothetical protein